MNLGNYPDKSLETAHGDYREALESPHASLTRPRVALALAVAQSGNDGQGPDSLHIESGYLVREARFFSTTY
jgi:hypothetical protein